MNQFEPIDTTTHDHRLNRIKALSKKGYADDGPKALYHALYQLKAKGFYATLEFALRELEQLYKLNEQL